MEYVENFKDLEVYKMTQKLSEEIFELTNGFPKGRASIEKMLNSMMKKSHLFCVNEEEHVYNRLPKTDY